MALIVALGCGWILEAVLICRPLDKDWDPHLHGVCGSNDNGVLVGGILNVTTDFTMITLPMPMIWRLQMAPQRKVALTLIFGLGFIVCGVSILRVVLATQINKADFTNNEAKIGIITNLEAFLGIIVACLPIFPPTLKKMLGNEDGPDSRNVISSSVARLRFRRSRPRLFRKFDDLYPLTDLEGTQNEMTGPDGKSNSSLEESTIKMHHQSAIKVKQDWDFRSDGTI